jgi:tetratricopeptide (TPR) repeat protein
MTNSLPYEIERGWELLIKAEKQSSQSSQISKTNEALNLMIDFEKSENINPEEYLRCQFLKGLIYFNLGKTTRGLKIFELAYKESLKFKKSLLSIDLLFGIRTCLGYPDKYEDLWGEIEIAEELLKSSLLEPYSEVEQREAEIYHLKATYYNMEGNLDLAVEFYEKSREIGERYGHFLHILNRSNIGMLGEIYGRKGELDQALHYQNQQVEFWKNSHLPPARIAYAGILRSIGSNYFQQGEVDKAINYFKQSLKILEQPDYQYAPFLAHTLCSLINAMLENKTPELAKEYLELFNQYNERLNSSEYIIDEIYTRRNLFKGWYNFSKALILKASARTRDRAEAEKILKELLESREGWADLSEQLVGFELCDIYLEELRTTHNLEILEDITPLIERLLKWSEHTNSFIVQANIKLLQGQLALLQMNMGDTRRYLSQAQQIAETHGLHLLARKVSYEHDKLLEQLDEWKSLKKKKIPISDIMDLVSLEETVDIMLQKRGIQLPELADEIPVLLLIILEGGVLVFSYPFSDEWKRDTELFGSFLSAFTSFSDEYFSEGLDRAKFGHYTVFMKAITNFSVGYLFKGPAYLAQKKLSRFVDHLQENESIQQTLDKFQKTSQILDLKDFPFLKSLITEIFIKKSPEISPPI